MLVASKFFLYHACSEWQYFFGTLLPRKLTHNKLRKPVGIGNSRKAMTVIEYLLYERNIREYSIRNIRVSFI